RYGKLNVLPIFMDTGWEHEITYKHIADVQEKLGIVIHHIKGEYSFFSLATKKKRFPSTKARFCTEFLKVRPFLDWLLKQNESFVIVQGIRAEESSARAKMEKECDYFKYYKQP